MADTLAIIKEMIVSKFEVKEEMIQPDKPFTEYDLDSLGRIELAFMVEDKFGISIPETVDQVQTLAEFASFVDALVAEKAAGKA